MKIERKALAQLDGRWLQTIRTELKRIEVGFDWPKFLVRLGLDPTIQIWVGEETGVPEGQPKARLVFLLEVKGHPKGKELFVWLVAGKGFFRFSDEILDWLQGVGIMEGCRWLGAGTTRSGILRFLAKQPGATLYTTARKEL